MDSEIAAPIGEWLLNGGTVGELIRSIEWSKTDLGPRQSWPQELRALLPAVLAGPCPMAIFWGQRSILFYNDAFETVFKVGDSGALGRPLAENSLESLRTLGELHCACLQRGKPAHHENMSLGVSRDRRFQTAYFDVECTPVRLRNGVSAGTFFTLFETTESVLCERRLRLLSAFSANLAEEGNSPSAVLSRLDVSPDVPFALLYQAENGKYARLVEAVGLKSDFGIPDRVNLNSGSGEGTLWQLDSAISKKCFVIYQIPRKEWMPNTQFGSIESVAIIPLQHDAAERPERGPGFSFFLVVGISPETAFDDNYEKFVLIIAQKIAGFIFGAQNRRALEASEAKFAKIFQRIPVISSVTEIMTGRFINVNQQFLDLSGYRREEVIGKTSLELGWISPDDRARLKVAMESTGRAELEFPVRTKNGREILSSYRGEIIEIGGQNYILSIAEDITERKLAEERLRESEFQYRSLFESMLDGCAYCKMLFDEHGSPFDYEFVTINKAFYQLIGFSDVAGKKASELFSKSDSCSLTAFYAQVVSTGAPNKREIFCHDRNKWLLVSAFSPKKGYFVTIFNDITSRKRFDQEREKSVITLRDADRRKNEFLALLSHELRNPLTPIRNGLHLLKQAEPGGEKARKAQSIMERQIAHLARLVDDLLDITRITKGKIQLQRSRVELGELVRRVVEDQRAIFDANGIRLNFEATTVPLRMSADPTRVSQVIGNLLGNAAKFTPRSGLVQIDLRHENRMAVLRVRDTGVGIAPDVLRNIFEPFTQAPQTLDRSRGGLGLGLALVKALVELHGGTAQASSAGLGRGAEFTVRLPIEQSPLNESTVKASVHNKHRRVLVVEDNADAADSLKEVLELSGHRVMVAYDGTTALSLANEFLPEVVLCDIGLPGMTGYEVAEAFKASKTLHNAMLIALTGYALPEDRRRATEAGFARHIAKPPDLELIEQLISTS